MVAKETGKAWWKSKTIWINGLGIIGGICTALSVDMAAGTTITLAGIINLILRVVTKQGLIK